MGKRTTTTGFLTNAIRLIVSKSRSLDSYRYRSPSSRNDAADGRKIATGERDGTAVQRHRAVNRFGQQLARKTVCSGGPSRHQQHSKDPQRNPSEQHVRMTNNVVFTGSGPDNFNCRCRRLDTTFCIFRPLMPQWYFDSIADH